MHVTHLQQFLRSLIPPLKASAASKVADDLEKICEGLEPFRDIDVGQFAEFLVQVEEYFRTGQLPEKFRPKVKAAGRGKGAGSPKAPPKQKYLPDHALVDLRSMKERALGGEITDVEMEAGIEKIKLMTIPDINSLLDAFDLSPIRKKEAGLKKIREMLDRHRDSTQMTGVIPSGSSER